MTDQEFLSDLLYAGYNGELPEATIKEACFRFQINFPPKRYETNSSITCQGSEGIWASTQNVN